MFSHVAWYLFSVQYFHLASSVSGWWLNLYLSSSQKFFGMVAFPAWLLSNQHFIKPIWVTNLYSVQENYPAAYTHSHTQTAHYTFPPTHPKSYFHTKPNLCTWILLIEKQLYCFSAFWLRSVWKTKHVVYILSLEVIGSFFYKEVHQKAALTKANGGKVRLGH